MKYEDCVWSESQINQLAVALASYATDESIKCKENWEKAIVASVQSFCAPCAPYASTILEFVINYGGGKGAPQIKLADSIAKQYNITVALGEPFSASKFGVTSS